MRALITNDDGIDSSGLVELARLAVEAGLDAVVAAPERESSGASASLTALQDDGRLVTERRALTGLPTVAAYAVRATPAFISFVGCRGAFGEVDVVLSGINHGPNTGAAVTHSGTVGAAITAALQGHRALAVSTRAVGANPDWTNVREIVAPILKRAVQLPSDVAVSVNVPDVEPGGVRGIRVAPLASFGAVQASVREQGEGFIRIRLAEPEASAEPDSDAGLLADGWATVTVLAPISARPDVDLGPLLTRA